MERRGSGSSPEAPLTFCDTVLRGQESLLEEALQHGAHRGPVDQLQHKEVGLPRKSRDSDPAMWPPHHAPEAKHSKGPHIHSDALLGEGPGALLAEGPWGPASRGSWDLGEP